MKSITPGIGERKPIQEINERGTLIKREINGVSIVHLLLDENGTK